MVKVSETNPVKLSETEQTLAVNFSAQADSVTWGKRVVFKIRTVKYEGKVYSGALIASSAQISKLDGPEVIEIRNPRI